MKEKTSLVFRVKLPGLVIVSTTDTPRKNLLMITKLTAPNSSDKSKRYGCIRLAAVALSGYKENSIEAASNKIIIFDTYAAVKQEVIDILTPFLK